MLIRIQERVGDNNTNAVVSFNNEGEYPITISDPFSNAEEQSLEWYFEEFITTPFMNITRAEQAGESLKAYGEALFKMVFHNREAFAEYRSSCQSGIQNLRFEIAGSPEFQRYHWEALRDPQLGTFLALEASFVRKNIKPQTLKAKVRESPTLNILIVTARSGSRNDVGYRTISRPLIDMTENANLKTRIEILRPATYRALENHLQKIRDSQGSGYYHIIHFDCHGGLMTYDQYQKVSTEQTNSLLFDVKRYGRNPIPEYSGQKAFLFLADENIGNYDPVLADEIAELIKTHQIPIVILNACQSAKQVGSQETSLASRLMQAGVQTALAMGYSVSVSAAKILMKTLYEKLYDKKDLPSAIRAARRELHHSKTRQAAFDYQIELEDWVLPVVYENSPTLLALRDFTAEENRDWLIQKTQQSAFPALQYGFFGRDLDILNIETRLLTEENGRRRNILLVQGMGGAGKTTLLHYLAAWWQKTHFVQKVFCFGYEQRAWTKQQIVRNIADNLLDEPTYAREFKGLVDEKLEQAYIVEKLRAEPHLLILDNLESITGNPLAIQNTLDKKEQGKLHAFLKELAGGKTFVLLGSRSDERWLGPQTFDSNLYPLPGLDPEAASAFAAAILKSPKTEGYLKDPNLTRLIKLLAGFPLAMQVILSNLTTQTPEQILQGLQAADVTLDTPDSTDKTDSILKCIDYSHSALDEDTRLLLDCLAPFQSVIYVPLLTNYIEQLRQQPALSDLPFAQWDKMLEQAKRWGLLTDHPQVPGYLTLQPTLPYFLRSRLNSTIKPIHEAIQSAFKTHYDLIATAIIELQESKEPHQKQLGATLARLEYENLYSALLLRLQAKESIISPYRVLSNYIDGTQEQARGLELGNKVFAELEGYPEEVLQGELGLELVGVVDDIASRYLLTKRYADAEASYQRALSLLLSNRFFDVEQQNKLSSSIYHCLGIVAQEQRQWKEAERYYKQALQIFIEFNDRYLQASTYHQLGRVAQEQRQWQDAERYYKQALKIKIEFNDRYSQASTYHNLGIAAQEQRQWQEAERYLHQALQIYIEFNDRYEQASTYHQLGRVAQEQKQWQEAERYYQQSLGLFADYQDQHHMAITIRNMALLWKVSGRQSVVEIVAKTLGVTQEEAQAQFDLALAQMKEE